MTDGDSKDTATERFTFIRQRLLQFFANPIVGVIGSVASVVGLVLAVVFYFGGQESRDLVYFVSPFPSVLAQAHPKGALQFAFRGRRIEADVVAVQVAFWNRGSASIRRRHILRGIEIKVTPPVHVLEASIARQSRDVIDVEINQDELAMEQGRAPVMFEILEKNDGASIQLVYTGPRQISIEMDGIIEGQGRLRSLGSRVRPPVGASERLRRWLLVERLMLWVPLGALILASATSVAMWVLTIRRPHSWGRRLLPAWRTVGFLVGAASGAVFVAMIYSYFLREPVPPFGF